MDAMRDQMRKASYPSVRGGSPTEIIIFQSKTFISERWLKTLTELDDEDRSKSL